MRHTSVKIFLCVFLANYNSVWEVIENIVYISFQFLPQGISASRRSVSENCPGVDRSTEFLFWHDNLYNFTVFVMPFSVEMNPSEGIFNIPKTCSWKTFSVKATTFHNLPQVSPSPSNIESKFSLTTLFGYWFLILAKVVKSIRSKRLNTQT